MEWIYNRHLSASNPLSTFKVYRHSVRFVRLTAHGLADRNRARLPSSELLPLGKRSSAVLLEGIAAVEVVVLDEVVLVVQGNATRTIGVSNSSTQTQCAAGVESVNIACDASSAVNCTGFWRVDLIPTDS